MPVVSVRVRPIRVWSDRSGAVRSGRCTLVPVDSVLPLGFAIRFDSVCLDTVRYDMIRFGSRVDSFRFVWFCFVLFFGWLLFSGGQFPEVTAREMIMLKRLFLFPFAPQVLRSSRTLLHTSMPYSTGLHRRNSRAAAAAAETHGLAQLLFWRCSTSIQATPNLLAGRAIFVSDNGRLPKDAAMGNTLHNNRSRGKYNGFLEKLDRAADGVREVTIINSQYRVIRYTQTGN